MCAYVCCYVPPAVSVSFAFCQSHQLTVWLSQSGLSLPLTRDVCIPCFSIALGFFYCFFSCLSHFLFLAPLCLTFSLSVFLLHMFRAPPFSLFPFSFAQITKRSSRMCPSCRMILKHSLCSTCFTHHKAQVRFACARASERAHGPLRVFSRNCGVC